MNPLLDELLVGAIIAAALGWFLWRALRRRGGRSCGGDCGCDAKKPLR